MSVAAIRREVRDPLQGARLPLQYKSGEDGQVDFMEAQVDDEAEGRVKQNVLIVWGIEQLTQRHQQPRQHVACCTNPASSTAVNSARSRRSGSTAAVASTTPGATNGLEE